MSISKNNAIRKRRLFLFTVSMLGILLFSPVLIGCRSKVTELNNIIPEKANPLKTVTESIIDPIESQPVYPGGSDSLVRYVERHIKFTPYMSEIDAVGKIIIRFVVEKDGSITSPEILRSLEEHCDEAAIKSLLSAPRFIKPAFQMGVPVRSYYTISVKIKLE